jgi:putative redox protein
MNGASQMTHAGQRKRFLILSSSFSKLYLFSFERFFLRLSSLRITLQAMVYCKKKERQGEHMGQIALQWVGEESRMFIGRDSHGHTVVAGSWQKKDDRQEQEWKGLKPSDLLVISLCSCSGYDVVEILKKQRQELMGLYITADAKQATDPPYHFTDIHLHYVITGKNISAHKVEKAIELSQNKYCSVAATIRGVAKITHSFDVKSE